MGVKIHKLAAIDIGSNSIRLLVSNVIVDNDRAVFKKSSLTRLPVRLGPDAFEKNKISKKNIKRLVKSMHAYANIMKVHGVERYRACATSALREAKNGEKVIQRVYKKTGVNIELIDGKEEARIIFNSEMVENIRQQEDSFLYMDVGGGSTEYTLFHKGKIKASRSFQVGTIRQLQGITDQSQWQEMEQWVKDVSKDLESVLMVGSGGNINRAFKLSGKKAGMALQRSYLKKLYETLDACSVDERMLLFDLNPDRADVITHALKIYLSGMKCSGAQKMLVPKKGLADGIVRSLYLQYYKPVKMDQ